MSLSLADVINETRETTITNSYNAAIAQIKNMVEKNPFQTTFTVTAGCVSGEMTNELAKRFDHGGVKAIVQESGLMSTGHSIIITCPLQNYDY